MARSIRDLRTVKSNSTKVTKIAFKAGVSKRGASAARFARYCAATCIAEMFLLGGTAADLRWDFAHGFVTVVK